MKPGLAANDRPDAAGYAGNTPGLSLVPGAVPDQYRKDIDGLRAIAVLAVIAFHANSRLVPGGFAGVDVFFVISGFLITGLLFNALESGTFSFTGFYARRIRRIFPAYIVVSLVTLAVSSWLLIPNDYIFYTTSLAASWAFVSNVFFSMLSWGYFGQRTEEFPLLHTWSLSVEEQFYFLFPVLLIVLFRRFRKYLVVTLAVLGVILVTVSQLKTGELKSYFLLTARAHELIVGSLTFFILRRFPAKPGLLAATLATLGMLLVFGSFVLINKELPFPGINSLFPCIGTALVIYGCRSDNAVSSLLKTRPLVGIGLISYSLYLWHWPIFAFLKYRQIELTLTVGLAAVSASLALAYLTWRFIETPARHAPSLGFGRAFMRLYAVPAALFMGVGLLSYVTEGIPHRFSDDMRELISSYSFERDLTRSCSVRAEDYKPVTLDYLMANCAFGATEPQKARVLLMGDSHAHHFRPFVERLTLDAGMKAVYHVQGGCFPTELQVTDRHPERGPDTCQQRNADLLKLVGQFDYVMLSGFWASEPERDLEKELRHVVETIVKAGATPVIFKDNPFHEPDLSRCILYRKRGWTAADTNCHIPHGPAVEAQAEYDAIVDRMKADYPKTVVIDPKRIMCNGTECVTHVSNIALYKDSNHINTRAAQLLGDWYVTRVGNPLKSGGTTTAGSSP
jgi:peptidoglycan/LPS O-acetylase OafA/YrhL